MCFAAGVQSFTSASRLLAQRVKLQNNPEAAPSIVTQGFSPGALSTHFTLGRLLEAARLPGRTEWAQLHPGRRKLVKRPRGGIGSRWKRGALPDGFLRRCFGGQERQRSGQQGGGCDKNLLLSWQLGSTILDGII